ncbi:MAG: rhodanese-like domain-containing protein [Thermoleophilia bacterium]
MEELTPQEALDAAQAGRAVIIDVREQHEYDTTHVEGVQLLPMSELLERVDELPDEPLIIMCRSGRRSAQVADYLVGNSDHTEVANLDGGIIAWAAAGLPYVGQPPS